MGGWEGWWMSECNTSFTPINNRVTFCCFQLITPANTPATPPNFPDALTMFSNMSTLDKMATSPKGKTV
jgi:hypothetical protein